MPLTLQSPACAQNGAEGSGGTGDIPRDHFTLVRCFPQESVSFHSRGSEHTAHLLLLLPSPSQGHLSRPPYIRVHPSPPSWHSDPPSRPAFPPRRSPPSIGHTVSPTSFSGYCLSSQTGIQLHESRGFCLLCSLLHPSS